MDPNQETSNQREEVLKYISNKSYHQESSLCFQDSELYEKLLRFATHDETLRVHNCVLNKTSEGMYFPTASIIHRYKLNGIYHSNPYVCEMIVKLRNDVPDGSKFRIGLLHENEVSAYKVILPTLGNFCEGPLPSPLLYYAMDNIFILECLGNRFYYPVHRNVKGLYHNYCKPILLSLAKFHSTSLICKVKSPIKFTKMQSLPNEVLFYKRQACIVQYMELYLEKLLKMFKNETWNDELQTIIETLTNLRKNFLRQIKELVLYPKQHDVFCHGDLRVSNILIKNKLEDARFIDFQQICYSSVARDLVTLFYVNLHPNELFNCTKDYLKIYWVHLHEHLKKHSIDLENVLTEDWLDKEMKRYQVYGVVYGLWHLPEFYIDNNKEQMTLHNLSKYKSEEAHFEKEFFKRAKSILLYYIKQVPLNEQVKATGDGEAATGEPGAGSSNGNI